MLNKSNKDEASITYPLFFSKVTFVSKINTVKDKDNVTGNDAGLNLCVREGDTYIGNDKL